jgi:NADPH:quinone reductase-like Zn-dependent oxidoreductase
VQIAKSFGAEVTGVCSTRNVDMVRSIGADHVIDYAQEDFTQGDERFDLIFETAGSHSPSEIRRALTAKGTLVLIGHGGSEGRWIGPFGRMIRALVLSRFVSQRMVSYTGKPNSSSGPNEGDLATLREFIESGQITPVIDRMYSLSETAEAIRYLDEGHARGKVVITASGPVADDGHGRTHARER